MATSPGFSNPVDTLTLDYLSDEIVDTVLRENVFMGRLMKNSKVFKSSTNTYPIKYQKGPAGSSFAGFDSLPTTASDTRVLMVYNPRFYAMNIALPYSDIAANNTQQQVLDILEVEMKSRTQDMADSIGILLYGTGTGNSNKDFLGLSAIDDDGTTVATIGNLSRSTYTTLQGTFTTGQTTLSLPVIRTLFNAIADKGAEPTVSVTDRTTWALFERLLQAQERIVKNVNVESGDNFKGWTGFTELEWAGMPIVPDRMASTAGYTGYWWMLNEHFVDWHGLPGASDAYKNAKPVSVAAKFITGNQYRGSDSMGFSWTGWINSINQMAVNSYVVLGGNLITTDPRRQGKISGISTV